MKRLAVIAATVATSALMALGAGTAHADAGVITGPEVKGCDGTVVTEERDTPASSCPSRRVTEVEVFADDMSGVDPSIFGTYS
ncbi:hypothetical protein ACFXD5_15475 [Streptomyces sp. NPDC059385]|uniref:hypothetical protein n=1 Tax=Streptomyces sp. NPDC059385 TaxID=3346817 RepID=UPI0036D13B0D